VMIAHGPVWFPKEDLEFIEVDRAWMQQPV
jgi:hypothetical protein